MASSAPEESEIKEARNALERARSVTDEARWAYFAASSQSLAERAAVYERAANAEAEAETRLTLLMARFQRARRILRAKDAAASAEQHRSR